MKNKEDIIIIEKWLKDFLIEKLSQSVESIENIDIELFNKDNIEMTKNNILYNIILTKKILEGINEEKKNSKKGNSKIFKLFKKKRKN